MKKEGKSREKTNKKSRLCSTITTWNFKVKKCYCYEGSTVGPLHPSQFCICKFNQLQMENIWGKTASALNIYRSSGFFLSLFS